MISSLVQPKFLFSSSLLTPSQYSARFAVAASALPPSSMGSNQAAEAHKVFSSVPHVLPPHRNALNDLLSLVLYHFGPQLQPSSASVPPEAERYQNDDASSHGSLFINRGTATSHIDFVLSSCLSLSLPNSCFMKVTNLHVYLKATTDAPHFLFELCQTSHCQFIFFLDACPRKDLVLNSEYRQVFYEDSGLDAWRKKFYEEVPEATPYVSSSIYFRCVASPTAILAVIKCEEGRAEEIVRDSVGPVANEAMKVWIEKCASKERGSLGDEMRVLRYRDRIVKRNAVETDLGSSLPQIFGPKGEMVLNVIRNAHGIS